ncbi:MAG: prolyl oligopeptidase family serine peptidase [Candidatus Hydrogenedentes bacterium]|nr:prolyl oligopeptidase family serine peptidase [Candidatus Hydrogenedentota bacterium]
MQRVTIIVYGCAACAALSAAPATQEDAVSAMSNTAVSFTSMPIEKRGTVCPVAVWLPPDYTADQAWPLVVFLHGSGERGDDGLLQTTVGIGPALQQHPERFPAVVLLPQCPRDLFWSEVLEHIEAAMEQAKERYNIDRDRVYLTGISMGGYGTWLWGAMKTDSFAALMPICGGGHVMDISLISKRAIGKYFGTFEDRIERLATVPIWAFHGADDDTVPPRCSREMVERVKAAGGDVHYTEFEGTGHNSWDQAYAHEEALQWLFSQRKSGRETGVKD